MQDEMEIWVRVLCRELKDAEVRQTLAIVEAGPSAFRIIQEYELKRSRISGKLRLVKSTIQYSQDCLYRTRDSAIEQAKQLVNKYCVDGWRLDHPSDA